MPVSSNHTTAAATYPTQRDMTYAHVNSSRIDSTNPTLHEIHEARGREAAHMAITYVKSETAMENNSNYNNDAANGETGGTVEESLEEQLKIEIPKGSQMEEILNNFFYNDSIPSNSLQPRAHAR